MAISQPRTKQDNSSLAERAYEEMKRRIIEGAIPSGYPLLESELAEEMGISRTPVREALVRLKQEGLVTAIRHRGIFVSTLRPSDMEEVYEMIEGLESMAVKLAAERATPEDILRMEEAVAAQEVALAQGDLMAWIVADEAFHASVVEAARNRYIREAIEKVNGRLHRVRRLTIRARQRLPASTEAHKATVEAIRAGDGELARKINQHHRAEARRDLLAILRLYSPEP